MQKKQMIIALGLVLALAIAAPTIGAGTGSPALKKATKALKTAKQAKKTAKGAKKRAGAAQTAANGAQSSASTANAAAGDALAQLDAAKARTDTVAGSVITGNTTEYQDLGGPSVNLTVPQSGLIEVWVQVAVGDDGAVAVYEDGQPLPDQDPNDLCATSGPSGALLSNESGGGEAVLATPGGAALFGCGSFGPPAPVLFQTTPGQHTYSLRYADCDCDPGVDGSFSDRRLTVAPRP
jgi:hypothetical protein